MRYQKPALPNHLSKQPEQEDMLQDLNNNGDDSISNIDSNSDISGDDNEYDDIDSSTDDEVYSDIDSD